MPESSSDDIILDHEDHSIRESLELCIATSNELDISTDTIWIYIHIFFELGPDDATNRIECIPFIFCISKTCPIADPEISLPVIIGVLIELGDAENLICFEEELCHESIRIGEVGLIVLIVGIKGFSICIDESIILDSILISQSCICLFRSLESDTGIIDPLGKIDLRRSDTRILDIESILSLCESEIEVIDGIFENSDSGSCLDALSFFDQDFSDLPGSLTREGEIRTCCYTCCFFYSHPFLYIGHLERRYLIGCLRDTR